MVSTILGERCQEGGRIEGTVAGAGLANAGYRVGEEGCLTSCATETWLSQYKQRGNGFSSENSHGQSPSLQGSFGVMHRRQHGSSAGKASVEASGSRSKKLAATDESLMLEEDGINGSRQRLKAQWEPGVELSDTSKILLSVSFQNRRGESDTRRGRWKECWSGRLREQTKTRGPLCQIGDQRSYRKCCHLGRSEA